MISLSERAKVSEKILEASLCGIYVFNVVKGKNLYINPEYTAITGWTLEQINDLNQEEFQALFHPEDQERIFSYMNDVSKIQGDTKKEIEYRFKHRCGHWVWCLSRDSVYERDQKGKVTEFIGSFIDVSEIKKRNVELLEKNEQLEQFVYSVSHDLRAPLVTVAGFVSFLSEDLKDSLTEKQSHRFERIRANIEDMSNMLTELLSISRILRRDMKWSEVKITPIIKKLQSALEKDIQESGALIELEEVQHTLYGSERLISQCLQNLIVNAIKFRDSSRSLIIKLSTEETNDGVIVRVEDTAVGIDERDFKRIFGVFESINSNDGIGVGLAIVKAVMDRHIGTVKVESVVGKGSVFILLFPKPVIEPSK